MAQKIKTKTREVIKTRHYFYLGLSANSPKHPIPNHHLSFFFFSLPPLFFLSPPIPNPNPSQLHHAVPIALTLSPFLHQRSSIRIAVHSNRLRFSAASTTTTRRRSSSRFPLEAFPSPPTIEEIRSDSQRAVVEVFTEGTNPVVPLLRFDWIALFCPNCCRDFFGFLV